MAQKKKPIRRSTRDLKWDGSYRKTWDSTASSDTSHGKRCVKKETNRKELNKDICSTQDKKQVRSKFGLHLAEKRRRRREQGEGLCRVL
jgi:hypothetical protein